MEREKTGGNQPKERAYASGLRRAETPWSRARRDQHHQQHRYEGPAYAAAARWEGVRRLRRVIGSDSSAPHFCRFCATSHFLLGDEDTALSARLPLQRGPSWVPIPLNKTAPCIVSRRSAYTGRSCQCGAPRTSTEQDVPQQQARSNDPLTRLATPLEQQDRMSRNTRTHRQARRSKRQPPALLYGGRNAAPIYRPGERCQRLRLSTPITNTPTRAPRDISV